MRPYSASGRPNMSWLNERLVLWLRQHIHVA